MRNPEDGTSPILPGAEQPEGDPRGRGISTRVKALAAILLLICIIGGGFLILRGSGGPSVGTTANTSSSKSAATPALVKPWCAAPASLSSNFSGVSISGLAENDVWSAGPQVMHWDGTSWKVAFNPSSPQDSLRSIVEIAPNDIWVVGEQLTNGLASHTLTMHWNGTGWQRVSSPDVTSGGKNALVSISGVAANDLWAVGFFVPQKGPLGPVIEHWNGTKWSVVNHLSGLGSVQFTSVKALTSDNAWAVGNGTSSHAGKTTLEPIIEHWNGKSWQEAKTPDLSSAGGGNLYNIGGSSASDLWAVGSANHGMLTEHWDGKSWSVITSPSVAPDSSNWLASVAASSPDNVWAVGRVGSTGSGFQSFIEHWDGHQWIVVQNPAEDAGELDVVTAVGQQFWIVGLPKASGGRAFIETLCP